MVQGILDDGLFRTGWAPEGGLQSWITAQARINFGEALGPGQDRNPGIVEFLDGRVTPRLLLDLDLLANGAKQVELLHLEAERDQGRLRGTLARDGRCGRLAHGGHLLQMDVVVHPGMASHRWFVKLLPATRCHYFGRNLGSSPQHLSNCC